MKIAILASKTSWYWSDLKRAGELRGHQLTRVEFESICGRLDHDCDTVWGLSEAGISDLQSFDAVIVRTMPVGSLEQVVFRMDALNFLEAKGVTVINSSRAVETAVDKYLSLCRLKNAGLPIPETSCCQSRSDAMTAFEQMGSDVVVKPLFGGEGRGIVRINSAEIADRTFKALEQVGSVLYLQKFVDHTGCDLRGLVIGERIFWMKRTNSQDWRTNASRGAVCSEHEPSDEEILLAKQAANATGCRVAGVDILSSRLGERFVLEVNAVPGWKALNQALSIDAASYVIELVESVGARNISV